MSGLSADISATPLWRFRCTISALLVGLGCVACAGAQRAPGITPAWPAEAWAVASPEAVGLDSAVLAQAVDFARTADFGVHALVVVRYGRVALNATFFPFAAGSLHDVASCTKSVTATLIGVAVDEGKIAGLDQPVLSFFPERAGAGVDPRLAALTLEDLLTMTGGMACRAGRSDAETIFAMAASPDWAGYVLDLPMTSAPGERFDYCSPGSHLLSVILARVTGRSALDYAHEKLFGPIGIGEARWAAEPSGTISHGWGDLRLRPLDLARLGLLYLRGGRWGDRAVVSETFVREATRTHAKVTGQEPLSGYGYQWWVGEGFFTALGRGGQLLTVIPSKDLVVVLLAGDERAEAGRKRVALFNDHLLRAARSDGPLQPDPEGAWALARALHEATLPRDLPHQAPPPPALAARVSGRAYALEPNYLGLASVSLELTPGSAEGRLRVSSVNGEALDLPVGLDGVPRLGPGRDRQPAATRGAWLDEQTFELDLDEVGNLNHWTWTLVFEGDRVTLRAVERNGLPTATIAGTGL